MQQLAIKPSIHKCSTAEEFASEFQIGPGDLVITNEWIYQPSFGQLSLLCDVLYQEQYGRGEPSDEMVDAMLAQIGSKEIHRIIAIGGGTVIDISKLFVFGGGFTCEELYAKGPALERKCKLIIIPTTCGTGSEVTGISIMEFKKKGTKLGLAVPALYADEAVLIPALLNSLPYEVFATSSIDALIHAVESYVSPKATPFSRAMGRAAMEDILGGYLEMGTGRKLPANMDQFLTASTMAGIAFSNAGCAAVHAMSYPVGGSYHVPHGKANYMLFEGVFHAYKKLGVDLSPLEEILSEVLSCSAAEVWTRLFRLLGNIYDNQPLGALGCDEAKCKEMAASVIQTQQRLLANNPVDLSQEQICQIYLLCL